MPTLGSFGAVTFGVRIDGAQQETSSEMSEMHIPGGSVTIVDIGGALPVRYNYELYFTTDDDYASMRALVGTSATLTAYGVTTGTAYLKSLRRTWTNPVGDNQTTATAEFIVP